MKKNLLVVAVAALLMTTTVSMAAAPERRGGFIGGIYGCCFGLRGAAAYNDGKDVIAMEWVDTLLLFHLWSFIKGWQGTTTADLLEQYGSGFF